MDAERVEPAVEKLRQFPGRLFQPVLTEYDSGEQHGKLVSSDPSAKSSRSLRNFTKHRRSFDKDFIAFHITEQGVDQAEVHNIARNHHPRKSRALPDHFTRLLIECIRIQHIGHAVMVRHIMGRPGSDVLRRPVIGRLRAFGINTDKLDNRFIGTSVIKPEYDRIRLDKEDLVVKVFRLLLMAACPARCGARTVNALLFRIPYPIASLVPFDPPVFPEIQYPALDRIDYAGKIILSGHVLKEFPHFPDGIFLSVRHLPQRRRVHRLDIRALLPSFDHIHLLIRSVYEAPEEIGIIQNRVHISRREIGAHRTVDQRL